MKQPDTAALRERLANYTPEKQLEQDKEELDGLTDKIYGQITALRNLLCEIDALKEELHGIHGSLKHTQQRERKAFDALLAVKDSADNIVDGICNAIVRAEQDTVIQAKIGTEELEKVNRCSAAHIKAEEELLARHANKLAKQLRNNEGIWLSNGWVKFFLIVYILCNAVQFLYLWLKT